MPPIITICMDRCFSMIGKASTGGQPLSLGPGCEHSSIVVHELMHAIGFYHSHQRSDRDEHLTIHWNNVNPAFRSQFSRLYAHNSRLFTKNFDFASVMMYGPRAFSRDGRSITMSPKDRTKSLSDPQYKSGLSNDDAVNINKLYKCN